MQTPESELSEKTNWIQLFAASEGDGTNAENAHVGLHATYLRSIQKITQAFLKKLPPDTYVREGVEELSQNFYGDTFMPENLRKIVARFEQQKQEEKQLKFRAYLTVELLSFLKNRVRYWRTRQNLAAESMDQVVTEQSEERTRQEWEKMFNRELAHSILHGALEEVRRGSAYASSPEFGALMARLEDEEDAGLEEIGRRIGKSVEQIKTTLKGLRKELRQAIRQRIAATLVHPTKAEIDTEFRELFLSLMTEVPSSIPNG